MNSNGVASAAKLCGLARRAGIHTEYRDMYGEVHATPVETLLALLNALGLPIDRPEQAADLERELRHPARTTTFAAFDGQLPQMPPGDVVLEDGASHDDRGSPVPMGVHRLHTPDADHWIIAAPRHCWRSEQPPCLGVFAPAYALNDGRRPIGDVALLGRLGRWAAAAGSDFVGTLPMLPTGGGQTSPYSPVSRLMWGELYLDPQMAGVSEHAPWSSVPGAPVEPAAAAAWKRKVLMPLITADQDLANRLHQEPLIAEYAAFRAASEHQGAAWSGPEPPPIDPDDPSWRFHGWAQLEMRRQIAQLNRTLKDAGSSLYLDLPVGADAGGFDVWRYRDQFLTGASVGAPPDDFFSRGQNWGFPPPDPRAAAASGLSYFREVLDHHCQAAGLLRIDHVMSLHRLWCIPEGFDARHGAYIDFPTEPLFAAVSLASHRCRTEIIGENLGTVPEAVTKAMREHRLEGMRVMQFEMNASQPLPTLDADELVCLNTHDMPKFAAWWSALDIERRLKLGLIDDDQAREARGQRLAVRKRVAEALDLSSKARIAEALYAMLDWIAGKPGRLLIDIEDLWGETLPQNVPGTVDAANWSRPLARSMRQIESGDYAGILRRLSARKQP